MPDFNNAVSRNAWADTNIMSADELRPATEKGPGLPDGGEPSHGSLATDPFAHLPTKKLYIETHAPYAAAGAPSGPAYLSVKIDADFVRTVSLLADLCVTHKLHSVETSSPPVDWGDKPEDWIGMGMPTLCVSPDTLWFEASDRFSDSPVHSREVKIADLIEALRDSYLHAVFLGDHAFDLEQQVLDKAEEDMMRGIRPTP